MEGGFKSCVVDTESYLLICQRYIELNLMRAGMVAAPEDYRWSSYWANGLAEPCKLWTPHWVHQKLGSTVERPAAAYRQLSRAVGPGAIDRHPPSHQSRVALGDDRFKQEIERLAGRWSPRRSGTQAKIKVERRAVILTLAKKYREPFAYTNRNIK